MAAGVIPLANRSGRPEEVSKKRGRKPLSDERPTLFSKPNPHRWLLVDDAARELGISVEEVRCLAEKVKPRQAVHRGDIYIATESIKMLKGSGPPKEPEKAPIAEEKKRPILPPFVFGAVDSFNLAIEQILREQEDDPGNSKQGTSDIGKDGPQVGGSGGSRKAIKRRRLGPTDRSKIPVPRWSSPRPVPKPKPSLASMLEALRSAPVGEYGYEVAEIASILCIGPRTLQSFVELHKVKGRIIGDHCYLDPQSLRDWLERTAPKE
jgi:hypothetical protein